MSELEGIVQEIGDVVRPIDDARVDAFAMGVAEGAAEAGATIFAVTTEPSSPLASLASLALIVPAATKWRREGEAKSEQPLGSLFDQCAHVVLDAVCLRLATRGGISNEAARGQHANVE